jgi:hypothetical protein
LTIGEVCMQLRQSTISNIAKMVCGDPPYNEIFPYRSSSYLTRFFEELDLPYVHDGSTRFWWVRSVLYELNAKTPQPEGLPSRELTKVIEYIVHPDHFVVSAGSNQQKAIDSMNEVLRSHELQVNPDAKTGITSLRSTSGQFVSTAVERSKVQRTITFCPTVFAIPEMDVQEKLVAVMMPFSAEYDNVYEAIKESCSVNGLLCYRADDIWANSAIMQDIFELIFASRIVVVDYTGRNSNVLYETGIAHTLGKP